MIKIKNLSKVYTKGRNQVTALESITLDIHKGDIYGIIGLSGAGKSSLIRCINRLEEPTSGDIWINGVNLVTLKSAELRNARKKMGMIFQNFNLLHSKTVFENIAFPLRLLKTSEKTITEKVKKLLDLVELSDKAHVYPSQLSGGQKQRVGIARALANEPDVLLCDEATSALDPKTTKQILDLLKNINKELGLTIVVITHEMEVIKEICSHVAILEGGYIVEEGHTIDIFSKPGNAVTKHFVEQMQHLPEQYLEGKVLNLSFTEGSAGTPIISRLTKVFDIDVNILSGKIEYIQEKPIGKLTVQMHVDCHKLLDIITYFEENHVKVEVLKQ
ncbi:methionine ABC transporter ATP-binding protein [Marinisporobacter balticus]|uniref:D-methionine transport system ATP-binding protein n=1 Tax=Marinisporobacter balticus TaxID=2018667 RepID=A0A4V2SBB1_9FIRM|nr:ATP-binding cassette domain-containing protein [Marinisporobacter balticus]TCO74830.1 D-methionine transport system ATP-binding protein [Marinisporobacter balticus]